MSTSSRTEANSSPRDSFLFNCDQLTQFCQRFQQTQTDELSEFLLEAKLKHLDSIWTKLESAYEKLMLSHDGTLTLEVKKRRKTIKRMRIPTTVTFHRF